MFCKRQMCKFISLPFYFLLLQNVCLPNYFDIVSNNRKQAYLYILYFTLCTASELNLKITCSCTRNLGTKFRQLPFNKTVKSREFT